MTVVALLAACGGCKARPVVSVTSLLGACAEDGPLKSCHLHLEVEEFQGDWRAQRNIAGYYGHGFRTSNANGVASTNLQARVRLTKGRYRVFARGYVDRKHDRRWRVVVGTSTLAATHQARPKGRDGFEWQFAGEVEVQGGIVDVRIEDRGDYYETADALILTQLSKFDPQQTEPALTVFGSKPALKASLDEVLRRSKRYGARSRLRDVESNWAKRSAHTRQRVLTSLGLQPPPPRTELKAKVQGILQRDGYRIERLVFESRPNMPVSAHVYVPQGPGPFPAMLSVVGHFTKHGKMAPGAAVRAHNLARQGILTLTFDPFGQGERNVAGHNHRVSLRLGLSGHTNMSIMVWDSSRAIDYLLTRPDVDPARIGVTGSSGGGLNALLLSVFDSRVSVSVPVAYVTQFSKIMASRLTHDACTGLPELAGYTDMGELAALFAPKPQLLLAGLRDKHFPAAGTEAAFRQAQGVYRGLNANESLRLKTFDVGHGYQKPLREQMYGFVQQQWLGGSGQPRPEELGPASEVDSDLYVFGSKKVSSASTSPDELAKTWAEGAVAELPGPKTLDLHRTREDLKKRLQGQLPEYLAKITKRGPAPNPQGLKIEAWRIRVAPGVDLAAFFYRGPEDGPIAVIIDGADRVSPAPLAAAAQLGMSALHVSLRGWGELADNEWLLVFDNAMLGDPLLGQRARELAAIHKAFRVDPGLPQGPMILVGLGGLGGTVGLFTQALYGVYDAAVLGPTPSSYLETFERELPEMMMVFGILKLADFPQVARLAAQRPLAWSTDWDKLKTRSPQWHRALKTRVATPMQPLSLRAALMQGAALVGQPP